jgi:uncharacterized protein YbjQ (UPF0145 family)
MLFSTLPHLGDRLFDVLGVVVAQGGVYTIGTKTAQSLLGELAQQAQQFGADGVVNITTVMAGSSPYYVMTGTAVKLR